MQRINEDLRVAMRVVQILKRKKVPMTSENLAKELRSTKFFVIKVAQELIKANLLESIRGAEGGFALGKNKKITALDVAQALGYYIRNSKEKASDMIDYKVARSFYEVLNKTVIR
jgi:DNA-binding IscR family transcriptional regulator